MITTTLAPPDEPVQQWVVNLTEEQWADWLKRLRSGNYRQGRNQLRVKPPYERKAKYCCLGVLCRSMGFDLNARINLDGFPERMIWGEAGGTETAPVELRQAVPGDLRGRLAMMNDSTEWNFKKIANWLEYQRSAGYILVVAP